MTQSNFRPHASWPANKIAQLRAEIERLQADNNALADTLKEADQVGYWQRKEEIARAEVEQLLALLGKLDWKSIDKDNMEFSCRIPYNVMDEIRTTLEPKT